MENMRLKYFLDVLSQPPARKMRRNSRGLVATKHPKKYFSRIFSEDRDHKTKERGEFRTFGTGGAHGPGHQLEGLIRITYQCDTTQVALVASKDTHYVIPTSTTKFKSGSPGKVF